MIISRTPFRISFFGGGTDFPAWFEEQGGCVLSAAITRYCYLSCRYLPPFFDHRNRIVYSKVEETATIDEIKHPAVRECLRFMNATEGVEIHYDGDLPKQTGLGTSSSFTVGLLNVLHALRGEMTTPMQLTHEAIHVERDLCNENVGSQDQACAAHGGLNQITFASGNRISVRPLTISTRRAEALESSLMLIFTGFSRFSSEIAAEQVSNIPSKRLELHDLGQMAEEGVNILTQSDDLGAFGRLMHDGWQLKKALSTKITNPQIDDIYARARKAGALGGKICGAGGGGFILLFVEPERQPAVGAALDGLLQVPFRFAYQGSQIIVYQPKPAEIAGDADRRSI